MHDQEKLASALPVHKAVLDTPTPTLAVVGPPPVPTGLSPYESYKRNEATRLSLNTHPLFPPPPHHPHPHSFPFLPPPPQPPPPSLHGSGQSRGPSEDRVGAGAALGGGGGGAGGEETGEGPVTVHWKQSGSGIPLPAVTGAGEHQSADDDDDYGDDDDELLTPPPPRERLSYTRYQLELLNGIFDCVRYPNSLQKQLIAKRVGISREQVKIWFQNRRRKDVVSNKTPGSVDISTSSSSAPTSVSPTITSTTTTTTTTPTSQSSDNSSNDNSKDKDDASPDAQSPGDSQGENGQKTRMVPEAVIKGCISELKRFSDEKLKERKEKRKAKGKRKSQTVRSSTVPSLDVTNSLNQLSGRLFQTYDLTAPPNKVTPTAAAYLDTSANRFTHSLNSSAFSHPRDHVPSSMSRLTWDGLNAGLSPTLGGGMGSPIAHSRGYGSLGLSGIGMGLMPTSQPQTGSVSLPGTQDTLPILSDLLSYRQQLDSSSGSSARDALLPQSSFLSTGNSSRDTNKVPTSLGLSVHNSGVTSIPSPFGVSHVFPFPLIADPPIMLSSLQAPDPLRHARQWPYPHPATPTAASSSFHPLAMVNSIDPYKPVVISSLSNPFYSPHPPPLTQWPSQPPSDPSRGTAYHPQR